MFSSLFASLTAKILAVAVAAAAATGGLAAAGALPGPAQQAASDAASTIGITLPSPHHDAAVTGTASGDHDGHGVTGTANGDDHVSGTAHGDEGDGVSGTATAAVNHGNCVSFATQIASSLGLTGEQKGEFVSFVAQDSSAVSAKVATGGTPGAACQTSLVAAKAAVTASANTTKHGEDGQGQGVSGTVTPGHGDDQGENGGDQSQNPKGDKDDSHGGVATSTVAPGSDTGHPGH